MDSIKVKNFIILVLVIVNTVLLAVILTDSARGRSSDGKLSKALYNC